VAQRIAFLIGNQKFLPESGLLPLQGPMNDVAALARLLGDPDRGGFKVHEFRDKPAHEVLPNIEQALSAAGEKDLILVFYSGHGKLARNGQLCLATANTRQDSLRATSIPAHHLTDLVRESYCGQVVLLLDCCYSGAVTKGDVSSELQLIEDAQGFYIMTATTAMKSARETELQPGGVVMGCFTAALVSGIESGAADQGRKGKILLSDLRHHLGRVVTGQTPQFFDYRASGDPVISLSPRSSDPIDVAALTEAQSYELSAAQGNPAAQVQLGVFYLEGRGGMPQQPHEAARLFKLAADQGNPLAQSYLAGLYEKGLGVPQWHAQAVLLYNLAAKKGDEFAQKAVLRHEEETKRIRKAAARSWDKGIRGQLQRLDDAEAYRRAVSMVLEAGLDISNADMSRIIKATERVIVETEALATFLQNKR
jgi:Caspase domain/Sel1 repeat